MPLSTEVLAASVRKLGYATCWCTSPTIRSGVIETPIVDGQFKTPKKADTARVMFAQITPLGRIGRAEEMASAALLLASSESSDSTGTAPVTDGGITRRSRSHTKRNRIRWLMNATPKDETHPPTTAERTQHIS
jgi:NAD(P)-dependent dehydrogenase (short-subunit alcohol dehydrogenase family)